MPAEVLENIAESVDRKALPAPRLASRECDSKVLRTFTKVFFTTVPILLCCQNSIHIATEIAEHSVFGGAIANIEFYIDVIPDEDDYTHHRLIPPWQDPKRGGPLHSFTIIGKTKSTSEEAS